MTSVPARAAAAALLVLSACATGGGQAQQDLSSLRAEVRTLQRENADLARRVESMSTQMDVLANRLARGEVPVVPAPPPAVATPAAPAAASAAAHAALAGPEPAPVVPPNLKVVKLEPARPQGGAKAARAQPAPPVSTDTPIQEPSPAALAALGASGRAPVVDAQAAYERARAQSGLSRARAMEQFADEHPANSRAGEALVDAARTRRSAGDPDGACEDFARAVAEYTTSRAAPDALEGLASCEQRRGRPAEASRLQARLAKDFPDSPAGKRASEHAPPVQGAAP